MLFDVCNGGGRGGGLGKAKKKGVDCCCVQSHIIAYALSS
jgi:hypothetical protein